MGYSPTMTATDNRAVARLRKLWGEYKGDRTSFAASLGISTSHLSNIFGGKKKPGPKLLKALGLVEQTIYKEVK